MNKIKGTLLYVQVKNAVKAYVKKGADPKPDEWKASVAIVDEDLVDEIEEFAKKLDTQISLKKVKKGDFEETYKVPPPEGAEKYVWVWTLKKSTELGKTGKPVPDLYRPRVYTMKGKTQVDITQEVEPANGSEGIISLDVFERDAGGGSIYLKNVMVTNLIPYVRTESTANYTPGSEFDDGAEQDDTPAPAKEEKPKADKPSKPAKKADDEPF